MRTRWLILLGLVGCTQAEVADWVPGDPWTWTDVSEPETLSAGFTKPMGLAASSMSVWLVDEGIGSVHEIDGHGEILRTVEGFTAPRWIAASDTHVVVTEAHEVGQVVVLDSEGSLLQTLHDEAMEWGSVVWGGDRFWWSAVDGSDLYSWAPGEESATLVNMGGPIQALTASSTGATLAIGTQKPWTLMTETGTDLGVVWGDPQGLAWGTDGLWITTRSARWPYPGWVYRLSGSDIAQVSVYSPPEPGPISVTDTALYWGSKQTLTRYVPNDSAYSAIGIQTAVADVVALGNQVFWTDRQRGVLLTWTD